VLTGDGAFYTVGPYGPADRKWPIPWREFVYARVNNFGFHIKTGRYASVEQLSGSQSNQNPAYGWERETIIALHKLRQTEEPDMPNTRSPKPEDYVVVDGSDGPRRDFRISVGLREGWDAEGRVFDVSEAVRTARAWMRRRVEAGEPALPGMFTRAEVTYAWPREDGTVGSDREPVAQFTGEAVHAYLGHLPDAAIEAMLNELAAELGAALGQERIYVAFGDRTWILDAAEHARGA
jgi:hypothetical protein